MRTQRGNVYTERGTLCVPNGEMCKTKRGNVFTKRGTLCVPNGEMCILNGELSYTKRVSTLHIRLSVYWLTSHVGFSIYKK